MGTEVIRFTKAALAQVPEAAPDSVDYYRDSSDKSPTGLVVAVGATGSKSFQLVKWFVEPGEPRGKKLRITLHKLNAITIERARELATEALADLSHKVNPNAEKKVVRERGITLGEAFNDFCE